MRASDRSSSIELDRTLTEREDRIKYPTGQRKPLKSALKHTEEPVVVRASSEDTISNQGSTGGYCWLYAAISILIIGLVSIVLIHYKDEITHNGGTTIRKSNQEALAPVLAELKRQQDHQGRTGLMATPPPNFSMPRLNFNAEMMHIQPEQEVKTLQDAASPEVLPDAAPASVSRGVASELDGLLAEAA